MLDKCALQKHVVSFLNQLMLLFLRNLALLSKPAGIPFTVVWIEKVSACVVKVPHYMRIRPSIRLFSS